MVVFHFYNENSQDFELFVEQLSANTSLDLFISFQENQRLDNNLISAMPLSEDSAALVVKGIQMGIRRIKIDRTQRDFCYRCTVLIGCKAQQDELIKFKMGLQKYDPVDLS